MSRMGQYALPWGVDTLLAVGAGRYGSKLLDLLVGEPGAYATGYSELKATGPSARFRTPRSPRVREGSFAGAYRRPIPVGEWVVQVGEHVSSLECRGRGSSRLCRGLGSVEKVVARPHAPSVAQRSYDKDPTALR